MDWFHNVSWGLHRSKTYEQSFSRDCALFRKTEYFITYCSPGILWWPLLPPKKVITLPNESCIQHILGALLCKWLWIHKLQTYEIHLLVKILGLCPWKREKKSFWHYAMLFSWICDLTLNKVLRLETPASWHLRN